MTTANHFQLTRYFSYSSAIGIVFLLILMSLFSSGQSDHELEELQSKANSDLGTMLGQVIWPDFAEFGRTSIGKDAHDLQQAPEIKLINEQLLPFIQNSDILGISIYNPEGIVISSTNQNVIGMKGRESKAFSKALKGKSRSLLTDSSAIDAGFVGGTQVDVIISYVPIRNRDTGEMEVIFGLYSDVSELTEEMDEARWEMVTVVFVGLVGLYFFLLRIVRKAESIIYEHEEERKEFIAKIHQMAYFDELTKLANRTNFNEKLDELIARNQRTEDAFGLMFFDLDGFKQINDTLGHTAGDELLKTVAQRLSDSVRDSDFIFRIGGDEFTGLFEGLHSESELAQMADKIIEALNKPISIDGNDVKATVSIGMVLSPGKDARAIDMVNQADEAMYRAKSKGKNCHSL